MRSSSLALTAILLTATMAAAQAPLQPTQPAAGAGQAGQVPGAAPVPATDPRLDTELLRWEQAMVGVQSLHASCTRTTVDKVFGVTHTFEGEAKFLKPNLALLRMVRKDNPAIEERFVCSGAHLFKFHPESREVRYLEIPKPKQGQVVDDSFLGFMFGMRAVEVKRRYDIKIAKEDQHYLTFEILPREAGDAADFQRAWLWLNKATYLPAQLWFQQPNKNEVTWRLPQVTTNQSARVDRSEFAQPAVPQGWKMVPEPKLPENRPAAPEAPPRVVRPNG